MVKQSGKTKKKNKVRKDTGELKVGPVGRDAVRMIVGLLFLALSVYTFISLIFYAVSWTQDISVLDADVIEEVENKGGYIGFRWADFLVSRLFGLGAFIIPVYFLLVSIFTLRIRKIKILRISFLSIFGAILFSLFFSYVFRFIPSEQLFSNGAGGSYGYYMNEWLCLMLGEGGTGILLVLLILIWLITLDNRIIARLSAVFDRWCTRFENIGKKKDRKAIAVEEEGRPEEMQSEETDAADPEKEHGNAEDVSEETADKNEHPAEVDGTGEDGAVVRTDDGVEFRIIEDEPVDEPEPAETLPATKEDEGSETEESTDGEAAEEGEIHPDPSFDKVGPVSVIDNAEEDLPASEVSSQPYDPRLDLSHYVMPSVDLLNDYSDRITTVSAEELEKNKEKIVKALADYKVRVDGVSARRGPTVTLYEIVLAPGVRVSQVKKLEEDIALSLAAKGVRVVILPGTNAIGIEVANEKPSIVSMKSVLSSPKFNAAKSKMALPIVMGKTISNETLFFDLAKMPHLLVAGATGTGKSVGLNAIIASLLYTKHPSELKLVLVDPKKVELSLYSKLEKHYLAQLPDADEPIITDTQKVIYTLKSLCIEMDDRYDLLKKAGLRKISEYNNRFLSRRLNPEKGHRFMPYIVVVIDEFADLLITAGREVEEPIARLAQLARAVGIHLIIATQRPTTNIITGSIKANFPARIAFKVFSGVDSKTILDQPGAKQLIGNGDMLIFAGEDLQRVQCAFIDTDEVEKVSEFIGSQVGYPTPYYLPEYVGEDSENGGVGAVDLSKRDKLFEEAARLVVSSQQGSTSMLQRKMNLGYNRAGRIMDQLEAAGIVGPYEGSKTRQVLITDFNSLDRLLETLR